MKDMPPSVVVYVNGSSYAQPTGGAVGQKNGYSSEQMSGPRPLDPYRIHREFPDRWRGYLHATFRSHLEVQRAFQVSEKTARNWWEGATGANGGYVAVAIRLHPDTAPQMLFAAE